MTENIFRLRLLRASANNVIVFVVSFACGSGFKPLRSMSNECYYVMSRVRSPRGTYLWCEKTFVVCGTSIKCNGVGVIFNL